MLKQDSRLNSLLVSIVKDYNGTIGNNIADIEVTSIVKYDYSIIDKWRNMIESGIIFTESKEDTIIPSMFDNILMLSRLKTKDNKTYYGIFEDNDDPWSRIHLLHLIESKA